MFNNFKNWLIKFAVKGLIKAGYDWKAKKILQDIIDEIEQTEHIKKKKKIEKQG